MRLFIAIFAILISFSAIQAQNGRGYGFPAQDLRNPPDTGMLLISKRWPANAQTNASFWEYKSLIPGWGGSDTFNLQGIRDSILFLYGEIPQPDTAQVVVYKPGHGQNPLLCPGGILPLTENFDAATAANAQDLPFTYAIGTRGPDSLVVKPSGFLSRPGHGLTVGQVYYQQNTPCNLGLSPGTIDAPVLLVIDLNTIQLIDRSGLPGSDAVRIFIPTSQFTSRGADPRFPTDSIAGAIATLYQSVGLARPGAIFVYQLAAGTNNPTFQAPANESSTPFQAWFWDGLRATRISYGQIAVNMAATVAGAGTLITPASSGSLASATQFLQDNYEVLPMPNGTLLYWGGTTASPDTIWQIADDPTGSAQILKLVKSQTGGSGSTNLSFSGASDPVQLNSSSGTGVSFADGVNTTVAQAGNVLSYNANPVNLSVSGSAAPFSINSSTQSAPPVNLNRTGGLTINRAGQTITYGADTTTRFATQYFVTQLLAANPTNLTYTGSGPWTLNSSTGTDVTNSEGLGMDISRTSNNLNFAVDTSVIATQDYVDNAVSSTGTNLTYTGSGPWTLNSSTGTDVTNSEGLGMDISRTANNLSFAVDTSVIATQDYVDEAIADIPAAPGTNLGYAVTGFGAGATITSSTGADVNLTGNGVTFSDGGGSLTLVAAGTNLTYTGSGPWTLNSSTGTDVTNSEGLGMDISRTSNNLNFAVDTSVIATQDYVDNAVSGVTTNLSFSGSTIPSFGPITLENSAGTDVTFTSAGIIALTRSGNNLLISSTATPTTENIYNSNGTISNTNRVVTITGVGSLTAYRQADNYGYVVGAAGFQAGDLASGGGLLANAEGITVAGNAANGEVKLVAVNENVVDISPATTTDSWQLTLPTTDGNAGQVLQTDGSGVTTWATPTAGTDLTYTGSGPWTLNSSTGTDVTNSEGLGMDISRTSNNLNFAVDTSVIATQDYVDEAIADIPAAPGTDLSYTILSGGERARINSSTGTDVTMTGENISFIDDSGELLIAAAPANLSFSGSSSPVTLAISTGADVTFVAGTNVTLSQSGNALTINATGGGGGETVVSGIASANTGVSNNIATVSVSAGSGAKPAVVTSTGTTPIFLTASYSSGTLTVRAWDAAGDPLTETTLNFSYIIGGQ